MATTAATPRRVRPLWRVLRWILPVLLLVTAALLLCAWFRPVELLWNATRVRLWFQGIHSAETYISFSGDPHVRVHYYVGGSGDPVVLVHGLGGRAEDWANLMPQLITHHRVYALDLPGYGRSAWPRNATYSIATEAAAVQAFIANMRLKQYDLGGWSMGGWVVMKMALEQPQPIRRLMIFDSAGLRFHLDWDTALFEPDTPGKLEALDKLLMPAPVPHVPAFIARDIFRFEEIHGWVVRENMQTMLTGADLLDEKLGALKMPMLIVWGKEDHLIPYAVGQEIHRDIPQSELVIFDHCGHLAPGHCSGKVGPVVRGFLDEKAPAPGTTAEIR